MNTMIFATHNTHKAEEIQAIMPKAYEVKSLRTLGFHQDIPETGDTLQENAAIKAKTIFQHFKQPCFADDTGLLVDALGGAPGVYSARYAGEKATFKENVDKILRELSGKTNRSAHFTTVICFIDQKGSIHFFEGKVEGEITLEVHGKNGFGYDPVFLPKGHSQTFAEMAESQKNAISHRAKAMEQFIKFLAG